MDDEEYPEYLKKQSYDDLVSISYSIDQTGQAKRYTMVIAEIDRRDKNGEVRQKPLPKSIQSWTEPSSGSRLDWKADRWKYAKLGLIPLTVFSIATLSHLEMTLGVVASLTVSAFVIPLLWLSTFTPGRIEVFEDRVEIRRSSGRGMNTRSIFYSDIQGVNIGPYKEYYRVTLQLKAERGVNLVTPDLASADRIREIFEKYDRCASLKELET